VTERPWLVKVELRLYVDADTQEDAVGLGLLRAKDVPDSEIVWVSDPTFLFREARPSPTWHERRAQ
jgi:hypothetical protein